MILKLVLLSGVVLLAGFGLGFLAFGNNLALSGTTASECPEKYEFINNALNCEPKLVIKKHEYTQLQYDLEKYIASEKRENKLALVAVYFRDFAGGPTFNIDSDVNFVPASLLKVPLMVTYLSLAESDKTVLAKKTSYSKVNNEVRQSIAANGVIRPNTSYTVEDLINRMIINSDNLAYGLLVKHLETVYPEKHVYESSMKELGLLNPQNPTDGTFSVKTYSSIFRQLYNSSYLSPAMSEKALEMLSKTTFNKALVAGVPKGTPVAHKFGDREGLPEGEKQFHDCGIVYYPDNPYLLCVMTRGTNSNNLVTAIKEISSKVYKEVDSRKI